MQNLDITIVNFGVEGTNIDTIRKNTQKITAYIWLKLTKEMAAVGKNAQKITEYTRKHLQEDTEQSQMRLDFNSFTGSK